MGVKSSSHLSRLISTINEMQINFLEVQFLPASKRVEKRGSGGQHQNSDVDAQQMIWERRLHQSVTIWQIHGRARLSALSSLGNWEPSCTTVLCKVHQLCNPGAQCTFGTELHYCTTVPYKVHLGNWGISCTNVQCKCSSIVPTLYKVYLDILENLGTIVLLHCTKCTLVIGARAKTGATTPHCLHQLLVTRACTSDR